MQVLVRDNNVDQALKVLKRKMQREGVFREMRLSAKEPLSLETPFGEEGDSYLGDLIEDPNTILPIDAAIHSNSK